MAGIDIHFIHVKPSYVPHGRAVQPLLMVHGWPGSFYEFYKIIPLLTEPARHGLNEGDVVFEVICPSIPGYGFSEAPHQKGKQWKGCVGIADFGVRPQPSLAPLVTAVCECRCLALHSGPCGWGFGAGCGDLEHNGNWKSALLFTEFLSFCVHFLSKEWGRAALHTVSFHVPTHTCLGQVTVFGQRRNTRTNRSPVFLLPTGFDSVATARIFHKLMNRLGFKEYYLQGGDWGSRITTNMAQMLPK